METRGLYLGPITEQANDALSDLHETQSYDGELVESRALYLTRNIHVLTLIEPEVDAS